MQSIEFEPEVETKGC